METISRGNASEAAVLNAFVARASVVLQPFGEGHPYDLMVDYGAESVLRVQCKTAWIDQRCALFNGRTTDHGRGPRSYVGRADAFGVYLAAWRLVYLVPVAEDLPSRVSLRLDQTKNNQRRGVRYAADYEFARWTDADLAGLAKERSGFPNEVDQGGGERGAGEAISRAA